MLFIRRWGHIVSAEPASACNSFATKRERADREEEDVIRVSPSNIWTETPDTSPETEAPQVKRAKREAGNEDVEEGEIPDSSDEEKEEEEGKIEDNTPCGRSCDNAKSPANNMDMINDSEDLNVNDGINKHSDSSRDLFINEVTDDN